MTTLLFAAVENREVFEFATLPGGWWRLLGLVAIFTLCYGVFWLYRREGRIGASPALRYSLAGVRCLVLLILAVIFLQPVVVTYIERVTPSHVAVVIDSSASMSITDANATESRRECVENLLESDDYAWLRQLSADNVLDIYHFGGSAEKMPSPFESDGLPYANAQADSRNINVGRTDIGQATSVVQEELSGQPIAGIIVITDGVANKGVSIDDIVTSAKRDGVKMFAVGVGEADEPVNVRVVDVAGPSSVPQGDPFEFRVEWDVVGVEPTTLTFQLMSRHMDEDEQVEPALIEERQVVYHSGAAQAPVLFRVSPTEPGDYLYWLKITPLESEAFTQDNERVMPVRVLDDQLRVLLVSGSPSYEYRYLTRLLERDATVNLSCWLQSADKEAVRDGNTVILELPREPADIFAYDAIILLDPRPQDLDSAWANTVKRFVDEFGGGVLYEAGRHYSITLMRDQNLRDLSLLLPIHPDPEASMRLGEAGPFQTEGKSVSPPPEGRNHPTVTFVSDPTTNEAIWSALPGLYWRLPIRATKSLAMPLLSVASASADEPVFVTQPYGAGRVAYLGFSGTWRWRGSAEQYYNQFWIQTVRYLTYARRQSTSNRGMIVLDRETVGLGEYLKIEARVLDEAFMPWHEKQIDGAVVWPDGSEQSVTLTEIPGRLGWFSGRVLAERQGACSVVVPLPSTTTADDAIVLRRYFRVQQPDWEMRTLRLAQEDLQQLAEQTGGEFVMIDQANALPARISSASERRTDRGPERDLWDSPWVLMLLALLLAIEWTLRRRNYLL